MSTTNFNTNNASVVKLWSNRIYRDFVTDTGLLAAMMSSGIVSKQENTLDAAGDTVTVSFAQKQTGIGLVGNQTADGQQNALLYSTDKVIINQLRYPISIPNSMTISQQRVLYNLPEDAYRESMDWLSERATLSCLYQLCGFNANSFSWEGNLYTGSNQQILQGMNPVTAPSVNRVFYPNGLTSDQGVAGDTTATFKLSYIDQLEYIAGTYQPYIRPISEEDGIKYHLYVHSSVWIQLIEDTSAPIQFRDIFTSNIKAGNGTGSIARSFDYSQTRVFLSDKLPQGVDDSGNVLANVRRAAFCGRDAAALCLGRGYEDGKDMVPGFIIREQLRDISNIRDIAINAIWGIKKLVFNYQGQNIDHGVIVMSTYTNQTYQS